MCPNSYPALKCLKYITWSQMIHQIHITWLADAVLIVHVMFAVFIISGLILILVGGIRHWSWVRNPWFRLIHILSIGVIVLESWCGVICPLTEWEMSLREISGQDTYEGGFIAHWLQQILYYDAPQWVFVICYTMIGVVVIISWIVYRPRRFKEKSVPIFYH
ncbi:MAG: DUF2784 domain-containing protein [Desulfobacterales bacterium]|nr:DUF2784 domain-containing protein [Desulfobacterales bacterium]